MLQFIILILSLSTFLHDVKSEQPSRPSALSRVVRGDIDFRYPTPILVPKLSQFELGPSELDSPNLRYTPDNVIIFRDSDKKEIRLIDVVWIIVKNVVLGIINFILMNYIALLFNIFYIVEAIFKYILTFFFLSEKS
ncbi:hypothetical protein QE152_g18171 [Popillia japonica]|uniref:Uncharacterized protein n=1 Tax=Popillia japonica TaxID=7064 RepID=A0AAW1L417_POPJA